MEARSRAIPAKALSRSAEKRRGASECIEHIVHRRHAEYGQAGIDALDLMADLRLEKGCRQGCPQGYAELPAWALIDPE